MKAARGILFVVFLLYSFLSSGQVQNLESLLGTDLSHTTTECFNQSFNDPIVYEAFWCNRNVKNLYKKCFQENINEFERLGLTNGVVIYLMSADYGEELKNYRPVRRILPKISKAGVSEWSFHALYDFNGLIFDLDYTTEPKVVNIFEYFKTMFNQDEKTQNPEVRYVVRLIPAETYAQNYSDSGQHNWDYFIEDPDQLYPLQDVLHYLKTQASDSPESYSEALEQLAEM